MNFINKAYKNSKMTSSHHQVPLNGKKNAAKKSISKTRNRKLRNRVPRSIKKPSTSFEKNSYTNINIPTTMTPKVQDDSNSTPIISIISEENRVIVLQEEQSQKIKKKKPKKKIPHKSYLNKEETPQERDNRLERRRSRSERSQSANSKNQSSIFNQEYESSKGENDEEDSPKEEFLCQKQSSIDPNEEILFIARQYSDSNSPLKEPPQIEENHPLEVDQQIIQEKPVEEIKEEKKSENAIDLLNENQEPTPVPQQPQEQAPRNNNQDISPSKENSVKSLSQGSVIEESRSNVEKEGEGDILDTITPLEIEQFNERPKKIRHNFSESNRGNLLEEISENPSREGEGFEGNKATSNEENDPSNERSHELRTVDIEAINSEESEEDLENYPMKTIYDWKRDAVNNENIEISRRSGSNSVINGSDRKRNISKRLMNDLRRDVHVTNKNLK